MNGDIVYRAQDGREWVVTLESPGQVLSVDPELEKSGAFLPEREIRIVFTSSGESISEEYTALARLEDLSDEELGDWFRAAREQKGL